MDKVNEYYELIDDEDLNSDESYESMILLCPECGALSQMKACGMRTEFPWFGYHPRDGSCKVLTDEFAVIVESRFRKCNSINSTRVINKSKLDKAIEALKE